MMHMTMVLFTVLHAVVGLRSCKGIKVKELDAVSVARNLLCLYILIVKGIVTIVIISIDTELCYVGRLPTIVCIDVLSFYMHRKLVKLPPLQDLLLELCTKTKIIIKL